VTWTRCDCGCGWTGLDDVTQFCVEEAAFEYVEQREALLKANAVEDGTGGDAEDAGMAEAMKMARDFAAGKS
jgi:hypothetical protein